MAEQTKVFPEDGFGGASKLVREHPTHTTPDRVEATIPTGPWLVDPLVGVTGSALAVTLDDVTGYVDDLQLPAGKSSVSLSIRLDLIAPVPIDGRLVTSTGTSLGIDEAGGTSTGVARSADGGVLAAMTQRTHILTMPPGFTPTAASQAVIPDDRPLRNQLGIIEAGTGVLDFPGSPAADNSMGNMHGGIYIFLAELTAHSALPGTGLHAVSIETSYLRGRPALERTRFTATVLRQGRSSAAVRVDVAGDDGLLAATSTVLLQR